jgi:hypothetical protein
MSNAMLDALGYVGASLDKPGRAVRGLLGGRPEEALAAIPFSDAMGLTDERNRVSGADLLRQMGADVGDGLGGTLAGIGVEMATDPLMFAGAGLGAMLGRRAGTAAVARGPMYETTADDLLRQVGELGEPWKQEAATRHINALNASAPRVFSEVAPGSKFVGVGAEGFAVRPEAGGDVVRLGMQMPNEPGRAVNDFLAQPSRTADYAAGGGRMARAERVPFAEKVDSQAYWHGPGYPDGAPSKWQNPSRLDALTENVERSGHFATDMKPANVGNIGGRDVIIDPGSFLAAEGFTNFNPVVRGGEPSALMRRLLDMTDARDLIRAGQTPDFAMPFARFGGAAGAGTGAAGRTLEDF